MYFSLRACLVGSLIVLILALPAFSADVTFYARNVDGISCSVIDIPMSDRKYRVDVEVVKNFPGTDEPFSEMVERVNPVAAVNGTFFGKNSLLPVGDIVKDGRLIHFGGLGTAVCLTKNNDVEFIDVPLWTHMDWSRYLTVLAAGPRLLTNGLITVNPREQGFSDPSVLGKANRVAIGVTKDNRMLWVLIRRAVSLETCAEIMLFLGCVNAMNSDGGSSQALYYNGEYRIQAGRRLTNIMYVRPYESGAGDALEHVGGSAGEGISAADHYKKGQEHAVKQRWDGAIRELKIATTLDPNQAAYYNALANAYSAIGETREQAIAMRQAGKIYLAKGMYETAVIKLTQGAKLYERDPEVYRNLALAYEMLDNYEMAAKMYKKAEKYAFTTSAMNDPASLGYKGITLSHDETTAQSGENDRENEPEDEVSDSTASDAEEPSEEPVASLDDPPFSVFDGEFGKRSYRDKNLGFTLYWPEEWEADVDPEKRTVVLSHATGPFYGTLQTFWVGEDETLDRFELIFVGRSFKSEVRRYYTEVDGYPALRTLYEEIINGESTGQQFFYVKKGRWIVVLSFMTYAANYSEGGPMFAQIVKSFRME